MNAFKTTYQLPKGLHVDEAIVLGKEQETLEQRQQSNESQLNSDGEKGVEK